MSRHLPRRISLLAACGLSVACALTACGHTASPGAASDAGNGSGTASSSDPAAADDLTPTRWGPISSTDKKLMTIVQQTSLREMTTSKWAEQRTSNPQVKHAAQVIISQHIVLEKRDLEVAKKLGLRLPDKPSADMQAGIDRMRTEKGKTFDTDYVNTLRQAHGVALILIANVRADTRNSLVRPLADLANNFIKNHINVLEATGDVDYSQLPVPPAS